MVPQGMCAGPFVALPSLLVLPNPGPPVRDIDVFDLHAERRTNPGEAEYHEADQRPVTQAGRRGDVEVK